MTKLCELLGSPNSLTKRRKISSQALQGCKEGSTTRLYGLEQSMKAHERRAPRTGDDIVWTIRKLIELGFKRLKGNITDSLGTGLYNAGATANAIIGLRDIVATDQTVGGIDQSSYSWWQGQKDSSTTTLTIASMQTVFNDCSVDSEIPSVIMMTRANLNRYHALLQANQRFVDSDSARGGFTSLNKWAA